MKRLTKHDKTMQVVEDVRRQIRALPAGYATRLCMTEMRLAHRRNGKDDKTLLKKLRREFKCIAKWEAEATT
jgi:hypothetical protein